MIATPGVAEEFSTVSVTASSVLVASVADSGSPSLGALEGIVASVSVGGVTLAFLRFFRRPKFEC